MKSRMHTAHRVTVTGRRGRRLAWSAAAACLLVLAPASAARPPSLLMRHVARDTTTTPGFQHATAVEPSIAAGRGGVLVTAFQVGRSFHRGAAAIGFSTSRDGGRSWRQGLFVPAARRGASMRDVTDAVVAFDRAHDVWLVASVVDYSNGSRTLQVHRSTDGLTWSAPVEVARGVIDHEALACDRSARSQFRGRCYLAFSREDVGRLGVRTSTDGGATWSSETAVRVELGHPSAAFPVTRPNGRLVLVFRQGGSVISDGRHPEFTYSAVSSDDGGKTFGATARVGPVKPYIPPYFRGVPALVPSVAVDARGRLYAVWQSCRFRRGCRGNDFALAQSTNGDRWSTPRRVPLDRSADHVIPGLAIAPASRKAPVRLGISYYAIAKNRCRASKCRLAPYFVGSTNGGHTWSRPARLHAPMLFSWLPQSPIGQAFVADNIGTAFVGTTAWSAVAVASRPTGGALHTTVAVVRVRRADLRSR